MQAPAHLGKYLIRREIGKGSMGIVYEGYDPLIQRSVAIKVIRESDLDAKQAADLLARLRREAQAAGRLNHPNIVAIYEYGEDSSGTVGGGDVAFIAMELAVGRELKDAFDAHQVFAPAEMARIMGNILAALQHAHDKGVTHRDVKPANVMLLPDGRVKVADFGVARIEASELTQAGTMIGTPLYMSPEQIMGYAVDGRSDLFACGVILYQFLTGEKPFTGSVTTVMQKVLHEEPMPPSRRNALLAPVWDALLSQAMAKKPADRFQTADEFAAAIRRAVAEPGVDIGDEATVLMVRTDDETLWTARHDSGRMARPELPAPPQRRHGWAWVLGAVALGAVGLGGYLVYSLRSNAPAVVAQTPIKSAQVPAAVPAAVPVPAPAVVAAPAPALAAAPAPAPMPLPTPAPKPAVSDVKPPLAEVPAPAPAPKGAEYAADWAYQIARVDAARGLTLASAMGLLLDIRSDEDLRMLDGLDTAFSQLPPHSAVAVGVADGQLVRQLQASMPSAGAAAGMALRRCTERATTPCQVVALDGEFRKRALVDVARGLGSRSVASVREAMLRSTASRPEPSRRRAPVLPSTPSRPALLPGAADTPTLVPSQPPRSP